MTLFLTTGVVFGQTAFNIFNQIEQNFSLNMDEIHLKLDPQDFNNVRAGLFDQTFKIKKISNCKIGITSNKIKFFLYKDMPGVILKYSSFEIMINSIQYTLKVENLLSVHINGLLEPLLNLRRCQSLNEALMNWSLNKKFTSSTMVMSSIKIKKLMELSMIDCNPIDFKEKLRWFLTHENIINFVPSKFIKKVKVLHQSKKNTSILYPQFMDIITRINDYFVKMVKNYYKKEHVKDITDYNLDFSIELYGRKEEIMDPTSRKSLYLVQKHEDHIHLKSFAILFNLRWFFNTRYNCKKSLGFDFQYGRTINGYAQTFHKYDDVLRWLVTHPNAIEDVEFVVLDPIPPNYIF
jgi:hypothetical protein